MTGGHEHQLTHGKHRRLRLTRGDPGGPRGRRGRRIRSRTGSLRVLAVIVIAFGFISLPLDWADHRRALALAASGQTVTVSDVRVHVGHRRAKGGGWHEVDRVQVRIAGVADDAWVDLYGLRHLELDPSLHGRLWYRGWQEPTAATSYRPPLQVVFRVGRNVDAMTPRDVARWRTSDDPMISAGIGASGLGLLAVTLLPAAWRRREVCRTR